MGDNSQPSFYDPAQNQELAGDHTPASPLAEAANEANKPVESSPRRGRPPKAAVAAATALPVSEGVTGDASITPASEPKEGETLEQAIARIRGFRQPFGALHQKLALPQRIGYHRHWFNDVAGRVDEAKASGWAHIKNPRDGTPLKRVVGTGRDNNVLYAFAMELPEVFWQEEMDARHQQAKEKIDAIKAKPFRAQAGQAQASDQGKFYNPHEETGAGPLQVTKG